MKTRLFSRARLSAWVIATLVGTSLVAVAPAAQALSPVSPYAIAFTRLGTDSGQMTVKDGERVSLQSSHILNSDWSGFPLKKGAVLTRTPFSVTVPAGVTKEEYGESRSWSGWTSNGEEICDVYEDTAKLVISNAMRCMDSVNVTDYLPVVNDSGSTKTVSTNALSQVLKNGKKVVSGEGVETSLTGWVRVEDVSSYTVTETESYISFDFQLCLIEENVEANDDLSISIDVARGATDLTSDEYNVYDWSDGDADEEFQNDFVYTVSPEGPSDDTRINFTVEVPETTAGTYTATADLLDGASSVIEECADSETASWPTLANRNDGGGSDPQASVGSHSWPNIDGFDSADWDIYSSNPDGFGGMFYWVYPESAGDDARVINLGPTGHDDDFNNDLGYVDISTGIESYFDIASYGADGSKFFALARSSASAWTLTLGSKSTGTSATEASLTKKALTKLCPTGMAPDWMSLISAPTANPMLQLWCSKGSNRRPVIITWANNKATSVAVLGAPSAARPCVVPTLGIDTRATGTDAAVIVYTRTSTRDSDGFCSTIGTTVSKRDLFTISAAGVRSAVTTLTTDPWSGNGEPAYFELAAGTTNGSWIGITYESGEDVYSPTTVGGAFTIDGTTFALGSYITLDESTDFGEWAYIQPVQKISSTKWTISIDGSVLSDGANTGLATLATLNPTTGVVTNGDVTELSDFGYFSSRILNRSSRDSNGNSTLFVVTGDDSYTSEFTTVTWTLP